MTRGYLEEVEAQLVARTEGMVSHAPGPRRPRRRRDWFAVIPALAAAAAIVIIVLGSASGPAHRATPAGSHAPAGHAPSGGRRGRVLHRKPPANLRHSSSTRRAASIPRSVPGLASGSVPAGFGAQSFTAISELTWWLLGSAPCSSPPCTSIVRTTDGGRSFAGIPAPRTTQVSQLRFADENDGFAYGPELWVTHDAGASWHQVDLGGTVTELEAGFGSVYAIVRSSAGSGRLMRSPVESDDWTTVTGAGDAFAGLWVDRLDVMLETSSRSGATQDLAISTDGGTSFTTHTVPPSVACNFEGMPPVIWAECPTGMMSGVWRSTDAGAHFPAAGGDAARSGLPEEPNSAAFAAASDTTAVYGYNTLYRTTDGGAHWSPTETPSGITWWQYIGFTDATHGVALGYHGTNTPSHERLYYTTDGGQSYHRVTIGAS